jgi:hypothetical protein
MTELPFCTHTENFTAKANRVFLLLLFFLLGYLTTVSICATYSQMVWWLMNLERILKEVVMA